MSLCSLFDFTLFTDSDCFHGQSACFSIMELVPFQSVILKLHILYYPIKCQAKSDTYEKLVKEMVMDQRARPSDRTKTPEEIAQEEKERLEKLEVCSFTVAMNLIAVAFIQSLPRIHMEV